VRIFRIPSRPHFGKGGAVYQGTGGHWRLRAGEEIPGFGHPLYPDGDPLARLILRLLSEDLPVEFAEIQKKINDLEGALHQAVNLDLAVAVVSKVMRLPVHSGFHLFALGRAVGWIAHAV
jgi:citrate synthase